MREPQILIMARPSQPLTLAAAFILALAGVIFAEGSPPAAVGETACACPAFGAAPRLRRAVPQSCRLCSGLFATNAGTRDLNVGAPGGGKVVVTAELVVEKALHAKGPLVLHGADVSASLRTHRCNWQSER